MTSTGAIITACIIAYIVLGLIVSIITCIIVQDGADAVFAMLVAIAWPLFIPIGVFYLIGKLIVYLSGNIRDIIEVWRRDLND